MDRRERKGVGFAPSSIHPLRPLRIALLLPVQFSSIAWTFHLSKRLCRPPFLLSSLREEGETSQTLVASAGEEEEGKACGKSVRVKAIFRRSFSFHPRKEYHAFLLLAIYLTTTKFLRNRFSPSAIQTANYLRSRRSTFNTGRENTYITFVIGGEDEWLSTVAVFASYNSFNSGKMKFFRPLFLSLSLVQARLIEGTDENYRTRSVINLWFQVYFN